MISTTIVGMKMLLLQIRSASVCDTNDADTQGETTIHLDESGHWSLQRERGYDMISWTSDEAL